MNSSTAHCSSVMVEGSGRPGSPTGTCTTCSHESDAASPARCFMSARIFATVSGVKYVRGLPRRMSPPPRRSSSFLNLTGGKSSGDQPLVGRNLTFCVDGRGAVPKRLTGDPRDEPHRLVRRHHVQERDIPGTRLRRTRPCASRPRSTEHTPGAPRRWWFLVAHDQPRVDRFGLRRGRVIEPGHRRSPCHRCRPTAAYRSIGTLCSVPERRRARSVECRPRVRATSSLRPSESRQARSRAEATVWQVADALATAGRRRV
ncbi:hypothetical protein ATL41_0716 [Flavimobilis soli]|uniref:Uncharacterized protein n=1 Tax=Flavimobilis soli TaxID=442709 RepID=A0A2A9EAU8_9MICO|nr:hypothetical protein ATL41_0716 [Flavimobilis soli]